MSRPSLSPVATRFLFRHRSKPDLYRRFQRPLPPADTTAAFPRTTERTVDDLSAEALYPFLRNCAARVHLLAPRERPKKRIQGLCGKIVNSSLGCTKRLP